jgi:hypothetical protein
VIRGWAAYVVPFTANRTAHTANNIFVAISILRNTKIILSFSLQ